MLHGGILSPAGRPPNNVFAVERQTEHCWWTATNSDGSTVWTQFVPGVFATNGVPQQAMLSSVGVRQLLEVTKQILKPRLPHLRLHRRRIAWIATVAEIVLALALLVGWKTRTA